MYIQAYLLQHMDHHTVLGEKTDTSRLLNIQTDYKKIMVLG